MPENVVDGGGWAGSSGGPHRLTDSLNFSQSFNTLARADCTDGHNLPIFPYFKLKIT